MEIAAAETCRCDLNLDFFWLWEGELSRLLRLLSERQSGGCKDGNPLREERSIDHGIRTIRRSLAACRTEALICVDMIKRVIPT
jgi:hypothetical protein